MSHHILNGAMDVRVPGTTKLVLCVVAHRAVMSSRSVDTTAAELALVCGLSRSCVRGQLNGLADGGWLSIERLPKAVLRIRVEEF